MTQAERRTTTSAISIADLNTSIDSEPRVLDVALGERLGFNRPRTIRELIARNETELSSYGGLPRHTANHGILGGRPTSEYYLNEPQALLICMFSNTAQASEVRRQLITVFMEYRRSKEKPIKVQAHERRVSTKLDNAISLARSAERLEALAATLQPRQQVLSTTIVEGRPVVFDPHDTDYQMGDAVLGFDWYGKMVIQTVTRDAVHDWRPGGIRLQYGQPKTVDGVKTTPAFFVIGKLVEPDVPHPPAPVAPALPAAGNDNGARTAERKGPYQDRILRLLDAGHGPTAIARKVGCSREAVRYWQHKMAA